MENTLMNIEVPAQVVLALIAFGLAINWLIIPFYHQLIIKLIFTCFMGFMVYIVLRMCNEW